MCSRNKLRRLAIRANSWPCKNVKIEDRFEVDSDPAVRGLLDRPQDVRFLAVLAHGAGSDARAATLTSVARALRERGGLVLRCDLPYRQARASGPPRPADAERDRLGIRRAIDAMRSLAAAPVLLGGHSYGGRQASMLAADDPGVADALLLMSYPLHPPGKPLQLRTAHLASITVPCLFVHGTSDAFGSPEEMRSALTLVRRSELLSVERAGHDLRKLDPAAVADRAVSLLQPASPGPHLP